MTNPLAKRIRDRIESAYDGRENGYIITADELSPTRDEARSLLSEVERQDKEIERIKDALHDDASGLVAALAEVRAAAQSRMWIVEGRGSYSWNDDRYRREAGYALKEIIQRCTDALRESGNLAHGEDGCRPKRFMHVSEFEKLQAELARLTDERNTWQMAQEECHNLQVEAQAELDRLRQQKQTDDELYRRCDERWQQATRQLNDARRVLSELDKNRNDCQWCHAGTGWLHSPTCPWAEAMGTTLGDGR